MAPSPDVAPSVADIIIPCIAQFDFAPSPDARCLSGLPVIEVYRALCGSDRWRRRWESQSELIGLCDDRAVSDVVLGLVEVYTKLAAAKTDGAVEVSVQVRKDAGCSYCAAVDGHTLKVDDLLAEFGAGRPRFPHQIPHDDVVIVCRPPHLSPRLILGASGLQPTGNAEFDLWMTELLRQL